MATTSDIRNGMCIHYNHDIYKIVKSSVLFYEYKLCHNASQSKREVGFKLNQNQILSRAQGNFWSKTKECVFTIS